MTLRTHISVMMIKMWTEPRARTVIKKKVMWWTAMQMRTMNQMNTTLMKNPLTIPLQMRRLSERGAKPLAGRGKEHTLTSQEGPQTLRWTVVNGRRGTDAPHTKRRKGGCTLALLNPHQPPQECLRTLRQTQTPVGMKSLILTQRMKGTGDSLPTKKNTCWTNSRNMSQNVR